MIDFIKQKNTKRLDVCVKKRQSVRGFSLPEIIVVVGIIGLLTAAVASFQTDVFSLNQVIQTGLQGQNEVKKILRPFANEVRSAGPSSLGSFALEETASSTFIFFSDIDGDGLKERVRYFLEENDFKKGIIKPSGNPLTYSEANEDIIRVVHNVTNTDIFTYYDSTYDGTSSTTPLSQPVSPIDVRLVKVEVIVDEDPNKPPAPVSVSTQVTVRNLKDNL